MKKIFSAFLAMVLLLGLLPVSAVNAGAETVVVEDSEDFFNHATCSVLTSQTEVTNGSASGWKLKPVSGSWSNPYFKFDQSYDISDHVLMMDVMPVGTSSFCINIDAINGTWGNAIGTTWPDAGKWTTLTFDFRDNAAGATALSNFSLATLVNADSDDYGIYIDNVRLVDMDSQPEPTVPEGGVEDALFNATCNVGEKQSEFTNGSATAWKVVPTATGWTYPTFDMGEKVDISKHELIMDIYPANMTSFAMMIANFDGSWTSYPGVYYETNRWHTVRVNLMENGKGVTEFQKLALGTMVAAEEGADYALYIDNVRIVERPENADATEETEKASDMLAYASYAWSGSDWTGAGQYSYTKNSDVTNGPDSIRSWRFSRTEQTGPALARMQINLGKTYDMTNKDLVFDIKFDPHKDLTSNSMGIVLYNSNWAAIQDNTNYQEYTVQVAGDGWHTVTVDNSILRAYTLDGKDLTQVMLLYLSFNFPGGYAQNVYLDNMRLVDHTYGTEETDAAADLLANATVVSSSADDATFFYNHEDTNIAFGGQSNASHKFSATASGSGYHTVKYDLGRSYDLTDKNIVMDLLAYRCSSTFLFSLYDSNNQLVSATYSSTTSRRWAEIRPAILMGLRSGKDLSDVRYIEIAPNFQADSTRTDRAFYVDNVRIEQIDTYYTNLENTNVVFLGDSITNAYGYKGWSGELQEHYYINRYNLGVGGASLANISGRSRVFAQTANIPSDVDIDFFILNGGVNDVWSALDDLGAVSDIAVADATVDSFDTATTAGAMEQLFCYLRTNYPNAKIGFVINYICYDSGFNGVRFRDEFAPLAKAVCDKWGVPYLDLVNNEAFNEQFCALPGVHTYDGVHGNDLGYELVMKQLAPWMLEIQGGTQSTEQDSDLLSYATFAWTNSTWNNDLRTYTNTSTDTYGPDSIRSWKFTATAESTGNHGLQINLPGYARFNLEGKAIQFDAKFESSDGKPSTKIAMNLYGHGWTNLLSNVVWTEGNGQSGWQTITMDASLFAANLLEGKDLSEINLIWFTFDFGTKAGNDQSVTIDNFRVVDVESVATKETEAVTDMFYGASYVSGYFDKPGFGHDEHVTEIVHGDDSLYSVKLYADDNYLAWTNATYQFPVTHDLRGKSLTIDLNIHNHVYLGITLLNSNQEVVSTDTIHPRKSGWDNIQDCGWEHYEIDVYGGLAAGMTEEDLADIRYIRFSASFEYVKPGRALYFDNLQTFENEQYESILNGMNGLYMGDSISEAIGYKGWAGELAEHYGVRSYNVSVSGSTLANNGIFSQIAKAPTGVDYDFVMLNGGVNDVWRSISLGEVTAAGTTEFDTATAIGALEHLFATLKATYPDAQICYILNYACVYSDFPTDTFINDFAPLARAACEKWDVHCLDLVDNPAFNEEFDVTAGVHTYDGVHANIGGYKVITKYVAPWIEEIMAPKTGVKYQQLSLGEDLTMRFDLAVEEAFLETATVTVTVNDIAVAENAVISQLPVGQEGCYQVSVALAAAQMTDSICVTVKNGDTVLWEKTYSIQSYIQYLLEGNYDDATKQMAKAVLHYGAKAQLYFDYKAGTLADAGYELTNAELTAVPTEKMQAETTGSVEGISFYGASLVYENKIAIRYYFTATDGVEGYTFTVNDTQYQPVAKDGRYYVEIPNLAPQAMDEIVTLTVSDGAEEMNIAYSALHYMVRMHQKTGSSESLKNLVTALYNYHLAAKAYAEA